MFLHREALMAKKASLLPLLLVLIPFLLIAQNKKGDSYKLTSAKLDEEGKQLDQTILNLNNEIATIIKTYNLMKNTKIKVLPFQFEYNLDTKKGYIELQRHAFIKDEMSRKEVIGIKIKKMKIFSNGTNISSIEYEIYENNHHTQEISRVLINDPSPTTKGTDDIKFKHINYNTHTQSKDTKKETPNLTITLSKVKNTTAFPIRNKLKRQFLIPQLQYFKQKLQFIGDSYQKSLEDNEGGMTQFLIKSTKF